jgi:hypothetical protein
MFFVDKHACPHRQVAVLEQISCRSASLTPVQCSSLRNQNQGLKDTKIAIEPGGGSVHSSFSSSIGKFHDLKNF